MDWPSKSLKSRVVWLTLRCGWWRARQRRRGIRGDRHQPAWWPEFERAFRFYVDSRSSVTAPPLPRPEGPNECRPPQS
jgi:hypothetical protein